MEEENRCTGASTEIPAEAGKTAATVPVEVGKTAASEAEARVDDVTEEEPEVCRCHPSTDFVEEQDIRNYQGNYYMAGVYCGIVKEEHELPEKMTEEERTAVGKQRKGCGGELKQKLGKMRYPRVCACLIKKEAYGIGFCSECYIAQINDTGKEGGRRTRLTRKA